MTELWRRDGREDAVEAAGLEGGGILVLGISRGMGQGERQGCSGGCLL